MPRSDEAAAFFHAVYSAVQEIPHGKCTSYGHIAKLIGTRKSTFSFSLYEPFFWGGGRRCAWCLSWFFSSPGGGGWIK